MSTSLRYTFSALLAASLCFVIACDEGARPAPAGGLRIVLETDMAMPKDIDHVRLEITQQKKQLLEVERDVGAEELLMPAAFEVASTGDSAPVKIRAIAYKDGDPRVERDAVTPIPENRVGQLRLTLNYLCVGDVRTDADGDVVSTCPDGLTCVQGSCVPSKVPPSAVPTYEPRESTPDGGRAASPSDAPAGGCFDVQSCFASATSAMVDLEDCTLALPAGADGENLNVALMFPNGGPGVCSSVACWVVLTGWTQTDDRIQLPEAACVKVQKAGATLVLTTACATAPVPLNSCGTWSSMPAAAVTPASSSPLGQSCTGPTTQVCGLCGSQTRRCTNGAWGSWEACSDEGMCSPGATRDCTGGGSETCSDTCQWGACECPGGQSSCGGACRSLDTDVHTCGACDHDCTDLAHVAGPVECSDGHCVLSACADGYGDCDGDPGNGCEASLVAAGHCGACDTACARLEVCKAATARSPATCVSTCTDTVCGSSCVDLDTAPTDCGGCGLKCTAPAHATPTCTNGQCGFSCNAGYAECAPGTCGDITSSDANCGACNSACPSGSTCKNGECACPGDASQPCGNCGTQKRTCEKGVWSAWSTCSNEGACTPGATQGCNSAGTQTCTASCQWGACGCSMGYTLCGNSCVDAQIDDDNCGKCGVVCGANTFCASGRCGCYGGNCPSTLVNNAGTAVRLAADGTNLYYTTYSSTLANGTSASDGTIMKVPVNGGAATPLATGLANPVGVATDGKYVYAVLAPLNSGGGRTIIRVPVDGGASTALATGLSDPAAWEIALDSTSVYFSGGAVYKIPLAGGTPTYLASGSFIGGLAVGGRNVYWNTFTGMTSQGRPDPETSVIRAVSVDGGAATTISSDVHLSTTVAADGNGVYFTRRGSPDDEVVKAPLAGGSPVAIGTGAFLRSVVTDGTFVYFSSAACTRATLTYSSSLAGRIVKVSNAGGAPVPIAGGIQGPGQLAVDQTNVYWLNVPCTGSPSIMKVHK